MKIKLLAPLFALLLLAGCAEDETNVVEPTPEPENLCYLQEQTTTSQNGVSTLRYTYNELNQVIRTEQYEQEVLVAIRTYTYTAAGKLAEERLLKPDGQEEVSFTEYSYNQEGLLSKYEVKQQVPGLEAVHRLAAFKAVYDMQNRLTSATDYLYLNNKEQSNGSLKQTYKTNKPVSATVVTADASTYTATFVQDSSRAPLSAVQQYLHRRPGIAYPSINNITAFNATSDGEAVADISYTVTYERNEQGYPVSATKIFNNTAEEKTTYTYSCP
ncbi:hypothetical protein [uncultured Pontibacter sp.]|uniref:hypothetical protein n=1 Tax=uncultured Pontibacter sp. TaxID=453356 RepID=UPI002630AF3B|nr:hypothetical protein [uncultured Pontibacter sp.]